METKQCTLNVASSHVNSTFSSIFVCNQLLSHVNQNFNMWKENVTLTGHFLKGFGHMWMKISTCECYLFTCKLHTIIEYLRFLLFSHLNENVHMHTWITYNRVWLAFLTCGLEFPHVQTKHGPRKYTKCITWIAHAHIFSHVIGCMYMWAKILSSEKKRLHMHCKCSG